MITHARSQVPAHYELRLDGHLDERWSSWFDGLPIRSSPLRDMWSNAACHVTGHPVDVASGGVFEHQSSHSFDLGTAPPRRLI